MNSPVDINYIIGLSFFEGIGPIRYKLLKDYFGSARDVFEAKEGKLLEVGLSENLVKKFISFRENTDLGVMKQSIDKKGIVVVTEEDDQYPESLRPLKGAPFILYCLGDPKLLNKKPAIAIVGTRKPTYYGKEVTKQFGMELASQHCVIISGMAMGVDAIAHQAALDTNGKTIAVLGCGVDICYPPVNFRLYKRIMREGLVVSEFPPGMKTSRGVFPSRNRIVAGLSDAVVVTEGAEGSGSLITASFAAEYGKDVYAVPGPVTSSLSYATNYLLKNGAKIAMSPVDIFSESGIITPRRSVIDVPLSDEEKAIVEVVMNSASIHVDDIARQLRISISDISVHLATLAIKGVVHEMENGEYTIKT